MLVKLAVLQFSNSAGNWPEFSAYFREDKRIIQLKFKQVDLKVNFERKLEMLLMGVLQETRVYTRKFKLESLDSELWNN